MKTVIHRSHERGSADHGWLKTHHSFSFGDWYEPTKMGFGTLRVLNDDLIAPSHGFGKHGHKNMEIITIVMHGEVTHTDSMGNTGVVKAGDVQVMSAGTGVLHSESNESTTIPLELFQLWIESETQNIAPRYEERSYNFQTVKNDLMPLVHKDALTINQDAAIFYGALDEGVSLEYVLTERTHGIYIFVIDGSLSVGGEVLGKRDAIGVTGEEKVSIHTDSGTHFLVVEVGMG
jgi:redox-sensitive bicupin YhaK (pirin superfamily)